jgi:hypothetical protein
MTGPDLILRDERIAAAAVRHAAAWQVTAEPAKTAAPPADR